jgi:hypothetical protein
LQNISDPISLPLSAVVSKKRNKGVPRVGCMFKQAQAKNRWNVVAHRIIAWNKRRKRKTLRSLT